MMRWLACRIPPPLLVLLCGWGMAQAAQRWPQWPLPLPDAAALGLMGILLLLAVVLEASAVRAFVQRRTTLSPLQPQRSSQLVVSGFYRISRNPMYLGMLCLLWAWGLWLGQLAPLVGPLLWMQWMTWLQIMPEERALQARFGEAYDAYRARVRRWL